MYAAFGENLRVAFTSCRTYSNDNSTDRGRHSIYCFDNGLCTVTVY